MNDDQHFDPVLNLLHVHPDLLDGEIVFQFGDKRPGFLSLLAHAGHHWIRGSTEDRQWAHNADHGLFIRLNAGDGPGKFVFKQPFLVGREEWNSLFLVHLANRETKIKPLAV